MNDVTVRGMIKLGLGGIALGILMYTLQEAWPVFLPIVLFTVAIMLALGLISEGSAEALKSLPDKIRSDLADRIQAKERESRSNASAGTNGQPQA